VSRKARRRARRGRPGASALFGAGPRWTALGRGLRRGARGARGRGNEITTTLLYAVAGALCLALAALLLTGAATPGAATDARLPSGSGAGLRADLIGAVVLGAAGVALLGLAARRLRGSRG
jgi:hypothetical protein